ncbi:Nucleotidyltransferase family protein, related [Eimeria necatrix]|uniref:Nucleotidyltransferase family protein, related n=1 Tax=Eimeria necatrix TaxID=51315 RepID=U6MK77_9EIME|nr:Nucleotidyltransferase family protein, related [Eimeria necatrix]CDJ64627.1 Nucleotidyltransferase family protein, related [Eimeria necatrix]
MQDGDSTSGEAFLPLNLTKPLQANYAAAAAAAAKEAAATIVICVVQVIGKCILHQKREPNDSDPYILGRHRGGGPVAAFLSSSNCMRSRSGGSNSNTSESHEAKSLRRGLPPAVTPAALVADAAAAAAAASAAAMELPPVPADFDALADDFISALGPNEERSRVRAEAFEHLRDAIIEAFTDFRVLLRQQQELRQQQQHQELQKQKQIQLLLSSDQRSQLTQQEDQSNQQLQPPALQQQDPPQPEGAAAGNISQEPLQERLSPAGDAVLLPPQALRPHHDKQQQQQNEQQQSEGRACRGSSSCCRARADSPSSFFSVSSSPSPTTAAAALTGAATAEAAAAPEWGAGALSGVVPDNSSLLPSSFQASTEDPSSSSCDCSSSSSGSLSASNVPSSSSSGNVSRGSNSNSSSATSNSNSSVRCLSDICVAVLRYGSFPLLTYLPDGDLDVGVITFSPETGVVEGEEESEAFLVYLHLRFRRGDLKVESQGSVKDSSGVTGTLDAPKGPGGPGGRGSRGPRIRNVHLVKADVKILKLEVDSLAVDLSVNKVGGCCSLALLELLDRRIGRYHLFKRSVILVKAWMAYESHLLGSRSGLLASYCLEVLVLHLFSCLPPARLQSPLQVLQAFLSYFSSFDWAAFAATAAGPLPLWLLRLATQQQQQQAMLLQQLQQEGCEPQQQQLHLQQMPFLNELLEMSEHSSGNHRDGDPRLERLAFVAQHIQPERGVPRDAVTSHVCKCIANFAFVEECRRRFRMCYGGMGGTSRFPGAYRSGQSFDWPDPSSPTAPVSSSSSSSGSGSGRVSGPATPMNRWSQSGARGFTGGFSVPPFHPRAPPRAGAAGGFTLRCINVVDPLLNTNNLGRSVSEPAFIRLVDALKRGHATLTAVLQRGDGEAFKSLVFKNSYSYLQRLRHRQALQPQIKPLILLRLSKGPSQYPRGALEDDEVPCPTRDPYAEFLRCLRSKTGASLGASDGQAPSESRVSSGSLPPGPSEDSQKPQLSSKGLSGAATTASVHGGVAEAGESGQRAERSDEKVRGSPEVEGASAPPLMANHSSARQQYGEQREQHQQQELAHPAHKLNLRLAEEELRGLLALCQLLCKVPGDGSHCGPPRATSRRGGPHYACASLNAFGSRLCNCSHQPVASSVAAAAEDCAVPLSSSSDASVGVAEEGWVGPRPVPPMPGVSEVAVLPIEAAAAAEAAITIQILLPYCTRGCRRNSSAGSYANDVRAAAGPPSIGSPRSACSLGRTPWEARGGGHRTGAEGAPRGSRGSYNDRMRKTHPFSLTRHRATGGRNSIQQQHQQHHLLLQHLQQHHHMQALPPSRDPFWQTARPFSTQAALFGGPLEGISSAAAGGPLGASAVSHWRGDDINSPSLAAAAAADLSPVGGISRRRLHRGAARQGGPVGSVGAISYQHGRHLPPFSTVVAARVQQQQQGRGYVSNSGFGGPRPNIPKEAQGTPRRPGGWSTSAPMGDVSEPQRALNAPRHASASAEERRSSSNSSNSSSSSTTDSAVLGERSAAAAAVGFEQRQLLQQQDIPACGGSYVAALTGHQGRSASPPPCGRPQDQQHHRGGGDPAREDAQAPVASDAPESMGEVPLNERHRRVSGDWNFAASAGSSIINNTRSAQPRGMRIPRKLPQPTADAQSPHWGAEGAPPTPSTWTHHQQQHQPGGIFSRGGISLPLRGPRGMGPNAVLQGLGLHVTTPSAASGRNARYRDGMSKQTGGALGMPSWGIPEPPQQPPPPPPPPVTPSGALVVSESQAEGPQRAPGRRNWAAVVGAPAAGTPTSVGAPRTRGTPIPAAMVSAAVAASPSAAGTVVPRPASAAARPSSPFSRGAYSQKAPSEGQVRVGAPLEEPLRASSAAAAATPPVAQGESCGHIDDIRGLPKQPAEHRKLTPQWGGLLASDLPAEDPQGKAAAPKWAVGGAPGSPRVIPWGSDAGGQEPDEAFKVSEQQQQQQWDGFSTPSSRGHSWAGDSTGLWRPGPPPSTDPPSGGSSNDARSRPPWGITAAPLSDRGPSVKQREAPSLTSDLLSLKLEDVALLSTADKAKALLVAKQQVAALQDAAEWRTATSKRERKKSSASGRHAKTQLAHLLAVQQLLLQQERPQQEASQGSGEAAAAERPQQSSQPDNFKGSREEKENSSGEGVTNSGHGSDLGAPAAKAAARPSDSPP